MKEYERHGKAIGSDKAMGQCGVNWRAGNGPWQLLNVIDGSTEHILLFLPPMSILSSHHLNFPVQFTTKDHHSLIGIST